MPTNRFLTDAKKYILASSPEGNESNQAELVQSLDDEGHKQAVTTGTKNRHTMVSAQAAVEQLIATMMRNKKLKAATGVIHTPRPSTPLLVQHAVDVSKQLVNKYVLRDERRRKTVTDRVTTLRKMLDSETHMPLVCLYQGHDYAKLTESQKHAYEKNKMTFSSLSDYVIDNKFFDKNKEFIGATYLLKDLNGKNYVFSIQSFQANMEETVKTRWGIWLGEYKPKELRQTKSDHAVGERFDTLKEHVFKPHDINMEALLKMSEMMQLSMSEKVR